IGWRLQFLKAGDAKTWATNVTNATKSFAPTAGSIMVLDAFAGSSQGHVGWVTASTRNSNGTFSITVQEGFARGTAYGKVNGSWNYFQHIWTIRPGTTTTARVSGGSIDITVLGFLAKK